MAVDREPLPLLATVDMGDAQFLLGRRLSAERRHVTLDGDRVRQVATDPGGEEFPGIVTYRGELGRDPIEVSVTRSVPLSHNPRAAKSVTGSVSVQRALLGAESPS